MKVAASSAKPEDRRFPDARNAVYGHELTYFAPHLNQATAPRAANFPVVHEVGA